MNIPELVDELYEAFAQGLGEPLAGQARDLPRLLRLAPVPGVRWSRVFSHEVTLGAPALFAEAMGVPSDMVRDAVMAHALAVIDAFGNDRIEDGQVPATAQLLAILGRMRKERDRAIVRLFGGPPLPEADYAAADVLSLRAIRRERAILGAARPVDLAAYERASLDKQCLGVIASLALARMAGWDDRRCRILQRTLESVWLGLQMYDDVVDWEDDVQGGGSWAVCLMKGTRPPASAPGDRHTDRVLGEHRAGLPGLVSLPHADPRAGESSSGCEAPLAGARLRLQVLRSGVLYAMLWRAVAHMKAARRRATALGAMHLAAWAGSCERRYRALATAEKGSAGYTVRAHALSAWAGEVLP